MNERFTIEAITINEENGDFNFLTSPKALDKEAALLEMRSLYEQQLNAWDLDDNNACNDDGEAIPGGCWYGEDAVLYAMPPSACGCLIQVCVMRIVPIAF